jgi:hypothetical protein
VSVGRVSSSSRGPWGGDALLFSSHRQPKPFTLNEHGGFAFWRTAYAGLCTAAPTPGPPPPPLVPALPPAPLGESWDNQQSCQLEFITSRHGFANTFNGVLFYQARPLRDRSRLARVLQNSDTNCLEPFAIPLPRS